MVLNIKKCLESNSLACMEQSILVLPHELIARILSMNYSMYGLLKHIYHFVVTCKEMYYRHVFLLYTLDPVMVSLCKCNKAISLVAMGFLKQSKLCYNIRCLDWFLTPKFTTAKHYQKAILDSINQFSNLYKVCLTANSLDMLMQVNRLPKCVSVLKINLITHVNPTRHTMRLDKVPLFRLKVLIFETLAPLSLTEYYYPFFRSILISKSPLYSWMAIDENVPEAHVKSPINQVCNILATLIYHSRSTLEYLNIHKLHPVFVFRAMDVVFHHGGINLSLFGSSEIDIQNLSEFPSLKYLKIDNSYLLTDNLIQKLMGRNKQSLIVLDYMYLQEIMHATLFEGNHVHKEFYDRNTGFATKVLTELNTLIQ